jgi:hypothetical protein
VEGRLRRVPAEYISHLHRAIGQPLGGLDIDS